MKIVGTDELPWHEIVRPGDVVMWGQISGEPVSVNESLLRRRHEIGGRFSVFLMTSYSGLLAADHVDVIDFKGLVGTAGVRPLSRAGLIDILPIHYSRLDEMVADGRIRCDVAIVQVSRPDAQGRMSTGIVNDYICSAVSRARVVVAEINAQTPFTYCDDYLTADDIDFAVEVDRPLVAVKRGVIGETERAIARHVVGYVGDRATIQTGIGALPDAILEGLKRHRDLGVHAGTITDGVMELMQCGAVTNAAKEIDRGVTVTGNMLGSEALFRFADRNPALRFARPSYTHSAEVLARLSNLISINAALEVDLTGQVNSEAIGSDYVGTIGGQVDYVRAAARSPGGRSIIALASTSHGGKASRIVARLSGPVTTPRSDVDIIVTEHGCAELATKTLRERARAMIEIAHPAFREELSRAAHAMLSRS
ncbi:MAG: acetyl-CoA hydrolase/transferase C-terminal domain-containing protein [Hyphomicrobiaceae bacterium]|nr:acetyl-CoA hydrolase/transferase C-terminal domain-containing protein [Hyphomicrobiaceae bacterium]